MEDKVVFSTCGDTNCDHCIIHTGTDEICEGCIYYHDKERDDPYWNIGECEEDAW